MESKAGDLIPVDIPMLDIYCDNEFNCRGAFNLSECVPLAQEIAKVGLIYPISVQPYDKKPNFKYRIVTGHRRFQAFRLNKAVTIPGVIKVGLTDFEARRQNLSENIKRKNLNILQEAKALGNMKLRNVGLEDAAKSLEVSTGWIRIRYLLLELPEEIQLEAASGLLSQKVIEELSHLPKNEQFAVVREMRDRRIVGAKESEVGKILDKKAAKKSQVKIKKEARGIEAIGDMQEVIRKAIGNSLPTRVLAWASGYINDYELYVDIKTEADRRGIPFHIPLEVVQANLTKEG